MKHLLTKKTLMYAEVFSSLKQIPIHLCLDGEDGCMFANFSGE